MVGDKSVGEARVVFHSNRVPMSVYPEVPGKVLGAMQSYRQWLEKSNPTPFEFSDLEKARVCDYLHHTERLVLGEVDTRPIMADYGLNLVPGELAADRDQALAVAENWATGCAENRLSSNPAQIRPGRNRPQHCFC